MEDIGFFDHIYEKLPPDFTAVFEIARVLEDDRNELTHQLKPLFRVSTPRLMRQTPPGERTHEIIVDVAEEYEASMLTRLHKLPRIYNSQWLLPEEVFYRRLAKKELWLPEPIPPTYYSVEPDVDDYDPDLRKQKLYILLDTSASMAVNNRIHLAKAIVYHVLRHNAKELGEIHLRTFDVKIGDLHVAKDRLSFHALISYVMRLNILGNGTAMAQAIQTAIHDIQAIPHLAGTEILIITDGACVLPEQRIRESLGDSIALNTLKIGNVQFHPSRKFIEEFVSRKDVREHQYIADLFEKREELRRLLAASESGYLKKKYEESIRFTEHRIDEQVRILAGDVIGHEIERLSQLYIRIDDVDLSELIHVDEAVLKELHGLFQQILVELDLSPSVTQLRKLALLLDHLEMLDRNLKDQSMKVSLEALKTEIRLTLGDYIGEESAKEHRGFTHRIPFEDKLDLRFLLMSGSYNRFQSFSFLLRAIFEKIKAIIRAFGLRRKK